MGIVSRIWVPSAAVVPQERGRDYLGVVDGADWSEGLGFHRGFFSSFRIKASKDVWFHFPIPTPVEADGKHCFLAGVSLLWEVLEGARIGWIVAQHGGMERLPLTERLAEPAFERVPFDLPELWRDYYPASDRKLTELALTPPLPLRFGVQLCVMVTAPEEDGTVRFYGAGANFSDG
jgi:hypothetical protein